MVPRCAKCGQVTKSLIKGHAILLMTAPEGEMHLCTSRADGIVWQANVGKRLAHGILALSHQGGTGNPCRQQAVGIVALPAWLVPPQKWLCARLCMVAKVLGANDNTITMCTEPEQSYHKVRGELQ